MLTGVQTGAGGLAVQGVGGLGTQGVEGVGGEGVQEEVGVQVGVGVQGGDSWVQVLGGGLAGVVQVGGGLAGLVQTGGGGLLLEGHLHLHCRVKVCYSSRLTLLIFTLRVSFEKGQQKQHSHSIFTAKAGP